MSGFGKIARACAVLAAAAALSGCVSFRPLEPVIAPPAQFRGDTLVPVEFVNPASIGLRCAQRGAKFLMLPGINSNACSNADLVSMPNPCLTLTGGDYAGVLCRELARASGALAAYRAAHPATGEAGFAPAAYVPDAEGVPQRLYSDVTVAVEFVATEKVALRCAERGAKMLPGADGMLACADADFVTMPNPCALNANGWYAVTMCHEMAHANGWPPDHRGGALLRARDAAPSAPDFAAAIPALIAEAAPLGSALDVLALADAPRLPGEASPLALTPALIEPPAPAIDAVALWDAALVS